MHALAEHGHKVCGLNDLTELVRGRSGDFHDLLVWAPFNDATGCDG